MNSNSHYETYRKKYNSHYLNQLKKLHELRKMKAVNLAYRNEILKKQKINNYQNELDRITGEMSKSIFKNNISLDSMKRREQELKEMIKHIN